MAQELWLLRHGDAEPHGARKDDERRLTPKGEAQARAAGTALRALGLEFTAVLSSPKARARATAELADVGEVELERALRGGDYGRREAVATLRRFGADERVLLVGHEPDFSQLIFDLAGGRVGMKKGGVAGVRLSHGAGELLVLLRPADLAAIAQGS